MAAAGVVVRDELVQDDAQMAFANEDAVGAMAFIFGGELGVTVPDEAGEAASGGFEVCGEVPGQLDGPGGRQVSGDAEQVDPAGNADTIDLRIMNGDLLGTASSPFSPRDVEPARVGPRRSAAVECIGVCLRCVRGVRRDCPSPP